MSLLNDASLILVPSAIKTGEVLVQKPLPNRFADETGNYDGNDPQGSANLTFARASNASRVASNGLIEKVRTNLVLQSQTFQTTWNAINASVSVDDTIAPDGTLTADKLVENSVATTQHRVDQTSVSASGSNTFSVYAKKSERDRIFMRIGISGATFDLTNGTITSVSAGFIATITDAGNGWYRCTISTLTALSNEILRINLVDATGAFTYSGDGVSGAFIWGAQYETSDIATDYIATTTAAVSVGPVANVPRLDYLGSSCGRLNLEPQRQNLVTFSEQMDNGAYGKGNGIAIASNSVASPDGYTSADKIYTNTTTNGDHYFNRNPFTSVSSSTAYTFSIFAKKGEFSYISFESTIENDAYKSATINLNNGAVTNNSYAVAPKVEDYGNGWYRISASGTTGAAQTSTDTYIIVLNDSQQRFYTGDGVSGIYTWGWQLEAGAYATSYIPTLGAAVTRLADSASKTGIASLIGQSEGTIYTEVSIPTGANDNRSAAIQGGSDRTGIVVDGTSVGFFIVTSAGVIYNNVVAYTWQATNKIALAYKDGSTTLYVNGSSVISTTASFTFGGAMANLYLGQYEFAPTTGQNGQRQAQVLLFKTRLTNAKLAELTTL